MGAGASSRVKSEVENATSEQLAQRLEPLDDATKSKLLKALADSSAEMSVKVQNLAGDVHIISGLMQESTVGFLREQVVEKFDMKIEGVQLSFNESLLRDDSATLRAGGILDGANLLCFMTKLYKGLTDIPGEGRLILYNIFYDLEVAEEDGEVLTATISCDSETVRIVIITLGGTPQHEFTLSEDARVNDLKEKIAMIMGCAGVLVLNDDGEVQGSDSRLTSFSRLTCKRASTFNLIQLAWNIDEKAKDYEIGSQMNGYIEDGQFVFKDKKVITGVDDGKFLFEERPVSSMILVNAEGEIRISATNTLLESYDPKKDESGYADLDPEKKGRMGRGMMHLLLSDGD